MKNLRTILLFLITVTTISYSMEKNELIQKIKQRKNTKTNPKTGLNFDPSTGEIYHDYNRAGKQLDTLCNNTHGAMAGCLIGSIGLTTGYIIATITGGIICLHQSSQVTKTAKKMYIEDQYYSETIELERQYKNIIDTEKKHQ